MKTKRERILEQIELQETIQVEAKINIVNCGHCGSMFLHEINEEYEIQCPFCLREMDKSDCPDYFYSGIENNAEFEEEEPVNECYIDYLDSQNKFRQTRKEFLNFDEAKKWMFENFEKFDEDFIKYF